MSDIKRLLNKKGWTGKELGQIELANLAYLFKQQKEGKEDPAPLVSQGEFRKMLNTLKDPVQIRAYNGYLSIHEWLSIAYNIASGQEQQAQSNFKTLYNGISVAQALENTYAYMDRLPVIMTEKQYKDFVEKRTKEITEPEDGGIGFNIFTMLVEALESLVRQLQTNPRKANPLKKLKPKLEKELVSDPRILARYNEVMGNGYYTIDETGERSDTMTAEEWQKAIALPEVEESLNFTGAEDYIPIAHRRIQEIAKATFRGATEEEIEEIKNKYSLTKPVTFHLYEEPPKDLNKWEILQAGDLYKYYRSLESLSPEGEPLEPIERYVEAMEEDARAFTAEFPEVSKAVLHDISQNYIEGVEDMPIEEWTDYCVSWAELHRLGFYDFDETYLDDISLFKGKRRPSINGVAILQKGTFNAHSIDSNGYYIEPNILGGLEPYSLGSLFTDYPSYADNANRLEEARETLLDSYYFLLGFNEAIELIGKYFGVPQLEVFKFDAPRMAVRMDAFNETTAMLYKDIKDREYEDEELKAKKLEVLKDFYYPLGHEELTIPQENIDKVIELFDGYEAFRDANITDLLCRREGGKA